MNERIREDPIEEAPPIFSSWRNWYIAVLAFLILLILLFSLFSKTFQ
jgi:hypothetical protein